MILTEADALTKWCPFARVLSAYKVDNGSYNFVIGQSAANRVNVVNSTDEPGLFLAGKCIASECMAWRPQVQWKPGTTERAQVRGYCGLSGRPEPE